VRLHKEFGFKYLPQLIQKRFVNELSDARATAEKYVSHVVSTIRGLIQQLYLSSQVNHNITKTLQLVLRLLKLWFQHGNLPDIEKLLRDGLRKIDLKIWIEVIPQLLARIDIKDEVIKSTLLEFIEKISLKFPQALIYSLSVT
jgi:FKBP12-rapamycin complex-associated protein